MIALCAGTLPAPVCVLAHSMFPTALWSGFYHWPYFTDEETDAYSGTQSWEQKGWDSTTGGLVPLSLS